MGRLQRTDKPRRDLRDKDAPVHVDSHLRKNGTHVASYNRSKPKKKLKKITTTRGINKGIVWTTQKEYEVDDRE